MSYSVIPTLKFKKQAKRLIKKYASLKDELRELENILIAHPKAGTSLGNNTFKIRLAVKSKGKGKSGGVHIITFLITEDQEIYLLSIYDKSEIANVDDRDLREQITATTKGKK